MSQASYLVGDVFDRMAELEDGSVDLIVTSPPFLALRSYLPADHPDKAKEIGSEPTPAAFIDTMLALSAEWRRLLAPHGSIAVELGDTYAGSGGAGGDYNDGSLREGQPKFDGSMKYARTHDPLKGPPISRVSGTAGGGGGPGWPLAKSKTLIPELYRIAFAYGIHPLTGQPSPAGTWRVRNVVTWCRPNPPVGALGDKWRPATSDIVVACVSGKRYWDDIATRRPSESVGGGTGFGAWDSTNDKSGVRRKVENTGSHAAGAPLLDYWELPPGGYPGSHYAVYPPALVEPLIKAMAPPKVCVECGEPARRIVERTEDDTDHGQRERPGRLSMHSRNRRENPIVPKVVPTGEWTSCGHGSIVCRACNGLVPYDHAIRRPREAQTVPVGVGEEEVLEGPAEGSRGQAEVPESVRGLRGGLPSPDPDLPSVQPFLFVEVGAHGGADELVRSRPGESSLEGRTEGQPPGIHPDLGSEVVSGTTEERLHDGASAGDAGASGSPAGTLRMGPPQERDQGRQPARELGDRGSHKASGNSDLPELRDGVPSSLDGFVCPCGSSDFKYVSDNWRPALILDPFAGSGTTLLVATGHGHDAVGIDIDQRNADLARQRIGELFLTVDEGKVAFQT